ncbi:MAG: hypothetical protein IPJ00_22875 [Saprospirales bacterium]|nr:hypothetical protein [Saprospirales bacterium]
MPKSDSSAGVFFIFGIITSIILCFSAALPAQNGFSPSGAPFIRNYPPDEYGAHNQNWAIAQDRRGVMYFGNSRGLLEYDGASWRLIQPEHVRIIRSMAASADGRIFGGGYGEIGYLAPDSSRQLQFVSLLPHLDEAYRDFTDVWQTLATSEGIFFVTTRYIFRWDGEKMRAWPAKTAFHFGFAVHDQFYIQQSETGLMQIVSDSLRLAPLGEQWREERISAMLPFSSTRAISAYWSPPVKTGCFSTMTFPSNALRPGPTSC